MPWLVLVRLDFVLLRTSTKRWLVGVSIFTLPAREDLLVFVVITDRLRLLALVLGRATISNVTHASMPSLVTLRTVRLSVVTFTIHTSALDWDYVGVFLVHRLRPIAHTREPTDRGCELVELIRTHIVHSTLL